MRTAIAASKLASSNGSASALACTAGAASGGRWAIITADGSTAVTLAVGRLVAAGARADVDDRARVAERLPDRRRDARVGARGCARSVRPIVVVLHASSRPQRGHPQHDLGRVVAGVALVAARARQRLLHGLDGQHAERARHAGAQLDVLDPARGLVADVVVVVGLAADHRAEAGDAGVAARSRRGSSAASGSSKAPGTSWTSTVGDPGLGERPLRAGDEPLGEVLVEAPDGDREARGSVTLRRPLGPARVAVVLVLGVQHLLVERQALVVQRVAEPVALGAQVAPRCAGWARARSGPARSPTGRSPRARRSSSGCW